MTSGTGDPNYRNMAPDYDKSSAFQAALDLVLNGCQAPNGYTEPVLHARCRQVKQKIGGEPYAATESYRVAG